MAEFLNSECPYCGQWVEYPSEGSGQTVPCPTCHELFVLVPARQPMPAAVPAPPAPPLPVAAPPATPPPKTTTVTMPAPPAPAPAQTSVITLATAAPQSNARPPENPVRPPAARPPSQSPPRRQPALPPLEQAIAEFDTDRAFAGHVPTRDQVARAWALAKFTQPEESTPPSHAEVIHALKKLFPEFRSPKTTSTHSHSKHTSPGHSRHSSAEA